MEEVYKKISEFNYTPPEGGINVTANVEYIFSHLIIYFNATHIELSQEEFIGFFRVMKDEILVSLLTDKRNLPLNEFLRAGFDFRGIKVRLISE